MILKISTTIFLTVSLGFPQYANCWGFYAHQQINRMAVFCLPPEIFGFFKQNIEFITVHAVDPDKRRYLAEQEGCRHFIDLDHYEKALPVDTVPFYYKEACDKYSKDTLSEHGIVPWHIQWMLRSLTESFVSHNLSGILKYAAELGHYVGDAHVPLHTTGNYNGQKTGQTGIHAFFETRLPEIFFSEYDFFMSEADYLYTPLLTTWRIVESSHACLDSVFSLEKEARKGIHESRLYTIEYSGSVGKRVYSVEYSSKYHKLLAGMVERRLRDAIHSVASFWYTAWVDAGQPDLSRIKNASPLPEQDSSLIVSPETPMIGRSE